MIIRNENIFNHGTTLYNGANYSKIIRFIQVIKLLYDIVTYRIDGFSTSHRCHVCMVGNIENIIVYRIS